MNYVFGFRNGTWQRMGDPTQTRVRLDFPTGHEKNVSNEFTQRADGILSSPRTDEDCDGCF